MTGFGSIAFDSLELIAQCLREAVSEAVANGQLAVDLCRCSVVPGEAVAYEFVGNQRCADNKTDGQGFVIGTGLYPSQRFPQPYEGNANCSSADLAMNVNVGIIRSYPVPPDGEPASQELYEAITLNQMVEMGIIHKVLTCCWNERQDERDDTSKLILGSYRPVGPDGAAIGGYWSATLEVG